MESVLEYSKQFHEVSQPTPLSRQSDDNRPKYEMDVSQASTSRSQSHSHGFMSTIQQSADEPSKTELRARIQDLDEEVRGCYADIETIQNRIQECLEEKRKLGTILDKVSTRHNTTTKVTTNPKGKGEAVGNVNFLTQSFDWTDGLRARMKSVFGIKEFRLCQQGLVHLSFHHQNLRLTIQ